MEGSDRVADMMGKMTTRKMEGDEELEMIPEVEEGRVEEALNDGNDGSAGVEGDESGRGDLSKEMVGLMFMAVASFFLSLNSLVARMGTREFPTLYLPLSRTAFIIPIPLIGLAFLGKNPFGPAEVRHLLVLRGVLGCVGVNLADFACRFLSIGDFNGESNPPTTFGTPACEIQRTHLEGLGKNVQTRRGSQPQSSKTTKKKRRGRTEMNGY